MNKLKTFTDFLFCKVCKKLDYDDWFYGDTCWDCIRKPCSNCRLPGHTRETCPAPHTMTRSAAGYVLEQQIIRPWTPPMSPYNLIDVVSGVYSTVLKHIDSAYVIPDQAIRERNKYHDNLTCLEFHPTKNNILLSGNMDGELVIWDFCKEAKPVICRNNSLKLNNIKFNPNNDDIVYASSSDGTVSCTYLETKHSSPLRLYPSILESGQYGMDINAEKNALLVADDCGYLNMVDLRSNCATMEPILIHGEGSTVGGLHCNPVQPHLLLSCASDRFARIWDIRRIKAASSVHELAHNHTVNSAFFSPVSGNKILTTSAEDNRLNIWDPSFGNMNSPSREIVHSHGFKNFDPYLTPHRAEWDPKDSFESLAVIGRSISANYDGAALHPIDFIDTSIGVLVAAVRNPNITTICPINKLHPRDDVLASASLRSVIIWRPKNKIVVCDRDENQSRKRKVGGESDNFDDDS